MPSSQTEKYWCPECGHVCQAPANRSTRCPRGHGAMTAMGYYWRPGKKGNRGRARRTTRYREWLSPAEWVRRRASWSPWPRPDAEARELLAKIENPPRRGRPGRRPAPRY